MNTNNLSETSSGLLDKLKAWFNWEAISKKLHLSRTKLIEIGLYLGIGFLAGFLLRKYAQFVAFLVLILVGLVVLQQLDLINITMHWDKIENVFGVQKVAVSADTFSTILSWIKLNLTIVVSFVVGFLFGIKIG
ncbi:hypothetical protein HRU45_00205 [Candidatus Dependentiae bacterium]|nr:hypothetical protein [Candidatus Dependentiae bacterium]